MPKHQLLRHVKAKSLSVKIPKNEPNTARLSWVLANEEFLTVEIPRYALERSMVQAKRAIEEAPLSLGGIRAGSVMLSVTKSHKTGKWPTNHCKGTSSRRGISTNSLRVGKRGNAAAGSICRAIAASSSRCSAVRRHGRSRRGRSKASG